MLSQDVAYLAAEDSKGFRGRLIMMGAQVCYLARPASFSFFCFPSTVSDFVVSICFSPLPASYGHFCLSEEAHYRSEEGQSEDP